MAGTGGSRPGSGRKPIADEQKISHLIDKCADITNKFLDDESIPVSKKVDVASRLLAKRIPTDMNVSGSITHNLFILEAIAKAGSIE